jgi:molybdate transport system substrate-binding protein
LKPYTRHFCSLSNPWFVLGSSLTVLAGLVLFLWSPWGDVAGHSTHPLRFYCAAGMSQPVEKIIHQYGEEQGVPVEATFDGSGKLLATLKVVGGQGDLYLAADSSHMRKAKQSGLVAETIPVAVIRPVLVVHPETQKALQRQGKPVTGLADLERNDLRVVIANPELASVGQMTREVLEPLGVWQKLKEGMRGRSARVSTVGTVLEVASIVKKQGPYIGIVWDVTADQFGLQKIAVREFADRHEHIWIGVLSQSKQPTAALRFARYLTARDRGLTVFQQHHYAVMPDADVWQLRPEITFSAGAMLVPAIADEIKRFGEREGAAINLTANGCGILVSQMKQIKAGQAPGKFPDAYFACDTSFMDEVQKKESWFGTPVVLTRNDIVLAVRKGNPKKVQTLEDLKRTDLRIGLAHPVNSALGELTDRLLKKLALHDGVYQGDWKNHIVHVDAGHLLVTQLRANALDVAVVYRSNVRAASATRDSDVDIIELHVPGATATQPFAIANDTQHKYLVGRLLDAICSPANIEHFKELGFHWQPDAK